VRRRLLSAAVVAAAALAGCAPRALNLPSGAGEPFPEFAQAFTEATASCRGVHTLTAELGLSGRAGGQKLRGRVSAGLSGPSRIRLEGIAPFGPPVFILAAEGSASTLLLPRDHRVLTGQAPGAILEALVGLRLEPSDLLAILTGCVVPDPKPVDGRSFSGGWARIDLGGSRAAFLDRGASGQWRVRSALTPPLRIDYEGSVDGASAVRIVTTGAADRPTDLRLSVSQVERNVALGPEVFTVKTPADASPITLDELRQAGPMGEKR
jgi:hypothetical protein